MDVLATFTDRLPHRPYCSNDPNAGLLIRSAATALQLRHIQPNPPAEMAWLIFDLDYPGAALAAENANLPPPTFTVINPQNAHAHVFYGLNAPVCLSDAARATPIRYAASIQAAFLARLRADPGYVGLIAKNPLHESWRVLSVPKLYDLAELAEYVDLPKRLPKRAQFGLGRNVTLFDSLRVWTYQWIREYKRSGALLEQWQAAVYGQAEKLNSFPTPLAFGEVKAISKSVARWTWMHFSDAAFSAIQSARGKRGGRPATTTKDGEPWKAMGTSRATYYRRQKKIVHFRPAKLVSETKAISDSSALRSND